MSKWVRLLPSLLLLFFSGTLLAENEAVIKLPPDSLTQWYKPANKRQVWLHNMFKLRREMQAVSEYLALGDQQLAAKWSERLLEHYRQIGEMVPEWQDELSLDWAGRLERAIGGGDIELAGKALKRLGRSCRTCHRDYRAVTAAIYRTPDFSNTMVKGQDGEVGRGYPEVMTLLSKLVNRVKIASEDGRRQAALESVAELERELHLLGGSCDSCHKGEAPRERFLGREPAKVLQALKESIEINDQKAVGRNLGTAAVITCARCHAVHRTLYDFKQVVSD
ncbi:MAG: hypothetical protein RPU64_11595 [Candidatus Sedimenticola sp. (ex Thyasira tokunagai)]